MKFFIHYFNGRYVVMEKLRTGARAVSKEFSLKAEAETAMQDAKAVAETRKRERSYSADKRNAESNTA